MLPFLQAVSSRRSARNASASGSLGERSEMTRMQASLPMASSPIPIKRHLAASSAMSWCTSPVIAATLAIAWIEGGPIHSRHPRATDLTSLFASSRPAAMASTAQIDRGANSPARACSRMAGEKVGTPERSAVGRGEPSYHESSVKSAVIRSWALAPWRTSKAIQSRAFPSYDTAPGVQIGVQQPDAENAKMVAVVTSFTVVTILNCFMESTRYPHMRDSWLHGAPA